MSEVIYGLIMKMPELPKSPLDKYKGLEGLNGVSNITGFFQVNNKLLTTITQCFRYMGASNIRTISEVSNRPRHS